MQTTYNVILAGDPHPGTHALWSACDSVLVAGDIAYTKQSMV